MIGLVLSGGGVKGAYQVGSYFAFKKCHIKIDGIVGCSIGSFNAAMIAAKKEKELLKFWHSVSISTLLGFSERFSEKYNKKEFDIDFFKEGIESLNKIINEKGIDTTALENILNELNLEKYLRKSKIVYGLSTFRLSDKKALELFIDDMKEGSLNNYIMSSCFLPVFKPKKYEDDSFYLDGGFVDYMPYNMLLNKGYDKVYCIDLKAPGVYKIPIDKDKIEVISPSKNLGSMLSLDDDKIDENIKLGYYDTLKVLKKLDGKKYIFKKKKDKFYKKLVKNINPEIIDTAKIFLKEDAEKWLVIKAVEYLMEKENLTYFKIYNIGKLIKKYQKNNDSFIINLFIKNLNTSIFS